MAGCNFSVSAWKPPQGRVRFTAPPITTAHQFEAIKVPCGRRLGCQQARAKAWAFRCRLEWVEHQDSCWATITYSDKYKPPTLSRQHLAAYIKRLRSREANRVIRFFACGEYGERTKRPHYHIILFGLSRLTPSISEAWGMGNVQVDTLTPKAINYVAGYCAKKIGYHDSVVRDRVDPNTGECYTYQPPFLQMSRKPGIASAARQHTRSWRDYAIADGNKTAVPRYLHEAHLSTLNEEELATLKQEKKERAVQLQADGTSRERELEHTLKRKAETRKL